MGEDEPTFQRLAKLEELVTALEARVATLEQHLKASEQRLAYCSTCRKTKPLDQFTIKTPGVYQPYCKQCAARRGQQLSKRLASQD